MGRQRKQYTGAFKAKIALDASKGQRTVQELATAHGVHPNQITTWKKQLVESAEDIFSGGARERRDVADELEPECCRPTHHTAECRVRFQHMVRPRLS